MKLRLSGTADECADAVEVLRVVLDVREASGFYPNRSSALGRVYLDVEVPAPQGLVNGPGPADQAKPKGGARDVV